MATLDELFKLIDEKIKKLENFIEKKSVAGIQHINFPAYFGEEEKRKVKEEQIKKEKNKGLQRLIDKVDEIKNDNDKKENIKIKELNLIVDQLSKIKIKTKLKLDDEFVDWDRRYDNKIRTKVEESITELKNQESLISKDNLKKIFGSAGLMDRISLSDKGKKRGFEAKAKFLKMQYKNLKTVSMMDATKAGNNFNDINDIISQKFNAWETVLLPQSEQFKTYFKKLSSKFKFTEIGAGVAAVSLAIVGVDIGRSGGRWYWSRSSREAAAAATIGVALVGLSLSVISITIGALSDLIGLIPTVLYNTRQEKKRNILQSVENEAKILRNQLKERLTSIKSDQKNWNMINAGLKEFGKHCERIGNEIKKQTSGMFSSFDKYKQEKIQFANILLKIGKQCEDLPET